MKKERFSKAGFILAALGMAIGVGNLWRFPREVARNGGGAFIIAWLVFLFIWAIPLLMIEFSIGSHYRKGLLGSFKEGMGKKFTWIGAFIAWVSISILFHYAVVTGWCIKYLFTSIFDFTAMSASPKGLWENFSSNGWEPLLFNAIALMIGGIIIVSGISGGIERVNKILIPTLFIILMAGVLRAVLQPGGISGLNYLFTPDFAKLGDHKVWINALSQAAFSTGAGWGLILTYSVYSRKESNSLNSAATIGFGDYSAALLAGMLVVPSLFIALKGNMPKITQILNNPSRGDQGLTFVSVPELFQGITLGQVIIILFFLALVAAAISSLIAMIELPTRILIDAGMSRKKAVMAVIGSTFTLGIPLALSLKFLDHWDATWGYGLIL